MKLNLVDRPEGWKAKETNDCTVRALANTRGIDYDTAHAAMKAAGRKPRRGMAIRDCSKVYKEQGGEVVYVNERKNVTTTYARTVLGAPEGVIQRQMTLGTFVKLHSKGRYTVLITGHATTVIDGEVHDTYLPAAGCRVSIAFKFPEPETKIVKKYSPVSQTQVQLPLFKD